jgi:lysozyme
MSPESKTRVMEQLKIDEGIVHEIYLDHLGLPTCGIGHLILKTDPEYGEEVGTPVSNSRCEELFKKDLEIALSECVMLYPEWMDFPEEVKEILVNMMFNMGRPRLSKFKKMNAALAESDWVTASVEGRDSRWYNQVGARANRLMSRLECVQILDK